MLKKTLRPVLCIGIQMTLTLCLILATLFGIASLAGAASRPSLDRVSAHPPFHFRQSHVKPGANGIMPSAVTPQGLTPSIIRSVYGLPSSGGTGTIALIEAYDNPNAESDLGAFDSQFGIASCTTANGCFEKYKMRSSLSIDSGWILESSLDVQWAHAVAPGAKILLVEARSSSATDLLAAVDYARGRPDVVAVSMSWGSAEFSGENAYDSHFVSPYGAAFFASAGDSGAGVYWPAVSSNVVGVGGTTLNFSGSTFTSETAWNGGGGGLSSYEAEPGYQLTYGVPNAGGFRAVPDVSYDADPGSGYSVYDSAGYSGESGWVTVGGTSAGAPQWAAIHSLGSTSSNVVTYAVASSTQYLADFRDIQSGSNGSCGYYCTAQGGYDYVTGLGSPLTYSFTMPVTFASVTGAAGGVDVSIDTTSHAGGSGAWTGLSGPVITETSPNQIAVGVHTLTLPPGWEFNTSHAVTLSVTGTSSFSLAAGTIYPGASSLSFSVATTSVSATTSLSFSGMQVRPTGTLAPSFGSITHSGAAISGVDGLLSFGALSTASGASSTVDVETTPGGGGSSTPSQSLASGSGLGAYAVVRDQFGNFVSNAAAAWSLVSKTGGIADGDLAPSIDNQDATVTARLIGTAKVHASISGLVSADSGVITVTPGTTTSISLSPLTATTTANDAETYVANGIDAAGNAQDVTASTTFSISAGAGGSFSGAVYTPAHLGSWTVMGTLGTSTATSSLQVTLGAPALVAIVQQPANASGKVSDLLQQQPAVRVTDLGGNAEPDGIVVTASVVSGQGTQSALRNVTATTTGGTGLAAFASLGYSKSGESFELKFTANGHDSAASNQVSPLAPASFASADFASSSVTSLISEGILSLPAGTSTATSTVSLTVSDVLAVGASSNGGTSTVTVPSGTVITASDGSAFDATAIGLSGTSTSGLSGFDSGYAVDGTLQWGIAGFGLHFSQPVTLQIFVGSSLNGSTLNVVRSTSTSSGWTSDGLVSSTCVVSSGICSFQATKASYYAAVTPPAPPAPSGGGGGGSSGGSSGGGGGGASASAVQAVILPVATASSSAQALTIAAVASTTHALLALAAVQAAAPRYLFTRDLGVGSSGADVAQLQRFLNAHGFIIVSSGPGSPGGESSSFGARTKAALARFQSASGISPASGYLGPKTRALIDAEAAAPVSSVASVASALPAAAAAASNLSAVSSASVILFARDLGHGMTGDDVSALQSFLIRQDKGSASASLAAAGATGKFGPMTGAALAEYQAAVGISPASGYLGPKTRAFIQGAR